MTTDFLIKSISNNYTCSGISTHIPSYYDNLVIPTIFYDAVIERNINKINNIIKNKPHLSISIVLFYDTILKNAFFNKKNGKSGSRYKIKWQTNSSIILSNIIILNQNEMSELYKYITTSPWKLTNMGFLINSINKYLVQLRYIMELINQRIPVNNYFSLGSNVKNNIEMKYYIAQFIL